MSIPTKLILSLSGGGVRVEFSRAVWRRIGHTLPVPEFVVGTSAGAVLGAIICSQRQDLLESKEALVSQCFRKSLADQVLPLQFESKYTGERKRALLQRWFGQKRMCDLPIPLYVVTYNLSQAQPVIFGPDSTRLVSEVLDATTAAPTYFPTVVLDGQHYIDGGLAMNNPAYWAFQKASQEYKDFRVVSLEVNECDPGLVTPQDTEPLDWGLPQWLGHGFLKLLMNAPNIMMNRLIQEESSLERYICPVKGIDIDDCSPESYESLVTAADEYD